LEGAEHLDLVKRLNAQWRPQFIGIEEAMQGSMTLAYSQRQGIIVRPLKHKSRDKVFRAKEAELLCENHRVYFPKRASWLSDWEHELLLFPTGTHDDQVDCFAYAAHELLRGVNLARKEKDYTEPSLQERCATQAFGKSKVIEHPFLGATW
jgi:predicted phage terminase large subunit-like protein